MYVYIYGTCIAAVSTTHSCTSVPAYTQNWPWSYTWLRVEG